MDNLDYYKIQNVKIRFYLRIINCYLIEIYKLYQLRGGNWK